MKKLDSRATVAARLFLGLLFTIFGLNGFLGFMPMPPHPEAAGAFLAALGATGYMFPLIKGTELLSGLLLLSGRFVPLGLTLLAPVTVNIFLFHAVLDPNVGLPLTLIAVQLYLAYAYRDSFRSVLQAKARPVAASSTRSIASHGQTVGAH